MKIKLIAPARKPEWGESFWDLRTLCKLTGRKAGGAPLALPTLAALTPADVEVVLTDENVEPIDFAEKVDLVGITGMTCVIPRSYEIADEYRRRGVPVALGGIHASMLPEEAVGHADSVVIGEAEDVWQTVIRDAQKKQLQKFYRAAGFPDLSNAPISRWDLLKNDKYCYFTLQTGRGCPYDCEFCSVKVFNGRQYRHKKIEQVIREVETLQKIGPKKLIFFADDNLLAVSEYAQELMKELMLLKIGNWMCQSSVNRLKDNNILELMHKAGCKVVFIGFESVSQKSLDTMNKGVVNRVNEYKDIVNQVHSHKIAVFGSFILGSDNDAEDIFKDTVDFISETNMPFAMVNVMTLLPGTKLYERLRSENRTLNFPWWQANADRVCYKPKLLSEEKLENGHRWILKQIYSYRNLYERLTNLFERDIFVSSKQRKRLTKTRTFFTLYALLNIFDFEKACFIIKSLWYSKHTSIMWVMTGVSYHNYAYQILNKKNDK